MLEWTLWDVLFSFRGRFTPALIVDPTFWGYPSPTGPEITPKIEVWLVTPPIKQNFKGVIIAHYKIYSGWN